MAAMLDSCVFIDVLTKDSVWYSWSSAAMARATSEGAVYINAVIYAEISVRFNSITEMETEISSADFDLRPIPREAAFLAGKCFARYRRRGGQRTAPLPDFFIGAHAMILGVPLVTRDPRRFREYFPKLEILCP